MTTNIFIVFMTVLLCWQADVLAQSVKQPPDDATGVQNTNGDTSPSEGFTDGQFSSRINDYFNQDEQININVTDGVVKVLRVNQKNLINDFITKLIPISNVTPREIRNVFRTVTGKEGGRAEVVQDKLKKQYFVQVICPKFQLPYLEDSVAGVDVEWLKQLRDGTTIGLYKARYRDADELDDIASNYAGVGATYFGFAKNLVRRRDEPYRTQKYLNACTELDQPQPQILLKFRIYEIDTSNDLKLGVDWVAWKNGPGRSLFDVIFAGSSSDDHFKNSTGYFDPVLGTNTITNPGSHNFDSSSNQYSLSANYVMTSAFMDFLRVKGKARVLDEATILAKTSQLGSWSSVDEFLSFIVTPDDTGPLGQRPVRLNTPNGIANSPEGAFTDGDFYTYNRFLNYDVGPKNEVGMTLQVFPVIGTESTEVEVEFEVTSVVGQTPQGTPILSDRRLVSKVRVVDGQPFVLGGMTRDQDVDSSIGAPWLSDIPVLGYMFGQDTDSARRKELVITCTPRVFVGGFVDGVSNPDELDIIAMSSGEKRIEMPDNSFGFDMWLFDDVEH